MSTVQLWHKLFSSFVPLGGGATDTGVGAHHALPPRVAPSESSSTGPKTTAVSKKPSKRTTAPKDDDDDDAADSDHEPLGGRSDDEDDDSGDVPEDLKGSGGKVLKKPAAKRTAAKKRPAAKRAKKTQDLHFVFALDVCC